MLKTLGEFPDSQAEIEVLDAGSVVETLKQVSDSLQSFLQQIAKAGSNEWPALEGDIKAYVTEARADTYLLSNPLVLRFRGPTELPNVAQAQQKCNVVRDQVYT